MNRNRLNTWVELATHDKRFIAAEIAGALILAYRHKLQEDQGMNRNILNFHDQVWKVRDRATNWWLDLHTAKVESIQEKLEEVKGTDEYEKLQNLRKRLEEKSGNLAAKATLITRYFNLGDPATGELSGSIRTLTVETDDGQLSVNEITPEIATEGILDEDVSSKLRTITDRINGNTSE